MPSHHRAKTVGYDEDDLYSDQDDYYDDADAGEELTEEDKEQMRLGSIQVREALGPEFKVSQKQIEDALWDSYYDVAKSVTFLTNKHSQKPTQAAQSKKPKAPSRFDQAAAQAAVSAPPSSGPSPDDIVLNAQAKGSKPAKKKHEKHIKTEEPTTDKLTIDDTKVKSKNLNVVEEFEKSQAKRMANFVVVGHVDHGKSTLMGRLLYDLKLISDRSLSKLRKEAETIGKSSFALAWVMDQTDDERSRGVTVDIATNYFETEKTRFTILDAPGHKDFIPNMIAGASQADFAVLVIDAGVNSFESGLKGQTKEHALLVRSMGVQRLIIAVNKMDTVSWSQDRFDEISQQMTAFLNSASFSPKNVTFIPCAGLSGENVTKPLDMQQAPWYTGPTLLDALDSVAAHLSARPLTKPLRLTISDVFRGGIQNPVSITGRLDSGTCQVGDPILAMPSNESGIIKAIELEDKPIDWCVAGQIPTIHLSAIDAVHLRPGDIVSHPSDPVKLASAFTAKIFAFEHVLPMNVDVFRGRLSGAAKVSKLLGVLDKMSGEVTKKKVRIVKPGEVARVKVELEGSLPLEAGMRVILRESGQTVASGIVEGTEVAIGGGK